MSTNRSWPVVEILKNRIIVHQQPSRPTLGMGDIFTHEGAMMPEDYAHGRRDGLRMALAIVGAEEAKWAALLGQSRSWRTNATREVRLKALQVAQQRIRTVLNRLTPKNAGDIDPELASALEEIGL
jgi:hypothetical protein